ncbi:MAG: putative membrane protein insertion efficiency factor [Chlamydiae bacterium]|nr:putative membrane protein insertion efficiency factor [Chlamydiota bacterium]
MKKILILTLLWSASLFSDPWGKDADLLSPKSGCTARKNNLIVKFAEVMIKFHQNNISKTDGPRSHFVPSSSQYTLESIQKYGFFYGFLLGCDRLMRENDDPWIYPTTQGKYNELKYDPVR